MCKVDEPPGGVVLNHPYGTCRVADVRLAANLERKGFGGNNPDGLQTRHIVALLKMSVVAAYLSLPSGNLSRGFNHCVFAVIQPSDM